MQFRSKPLYRLLKLVSASTNPLSYSHATMTGDNDVIITTCDPLMMRFLLADLEGGITTSAHPKTSNTMYTSSVAESSSAKYTASQQSVTAGETWTAPLSHTTTSGDLYTAASVSVLTATTQSEASSATV